ncbi:unnamed protein product [Bursaphelenchus okinawaensis]|uniref:DUF148 domain-containing protein n=1 Tax=Bursaphelenchus okinawaensis TaxID=465554 RepID=A0A811K6M9_9BILA|nr:unnamed protein product [Bursaphelenchus okinawaensis]CAG9092631.1 unnamed protein product [Bursaphelenchus okinawaensis]
MWFGYVLLPLIASAQYFSPIVPSNFYPVPMFEQVRRAPVPIRQPRPIYGEAINPINPMSFGNPLESNYGIGSDYAAYHQNAAMLQRQHLLNDQQENSYRESNPYREQFKRSDYQGFGGRPLHFQANFQSEPPIQVIHGMPQESVEPSKPESSLSLPKFLEGASDDVIQKYKDIIRKPNSRYDEQVKELEKLVATLDDRHQLEYHEFMSENDKIDEKYRNRMHSYVNEMSDPAQEQFAKISAVMRNPALPNEERWPRVLALYEKLDPKLRDEFESKFKGFEQH